MKVAPVLRALAKTQTFAVELVHTGQHYDFAMSGVFFEQLGIPEPDVHLRVGSGTHAVQTARIIEAFDTYLESRNAPPVGVVVVGDVNSTMACALVAAKRRIPVAHVEAGLRSFDRDMPEEINRLVTDAISDVLLVSEPAGVENLRNEGIPSERLHYCGNVMIDSLVHQLPHARMASIASSMKLPPNGYAVVTLHRPSNVDVPERLIALVDFIEKVSQRLPVLFPIHPRTAKAFDSAGLTARMTTPTITLSPALGYREFISAMLEARLLITDSGGVQEESTYLGIPCITLRQNTERPVTIVKGTNTLVGNDFDLALLTVDNVLTGQYKRGSEIDGWDGAAAERVARTLVQLWGASSSR